MSLPKKMGDLGPFQLASNDADAASGFTAGLDDYFLHLTSGKGSSDAGTYATGQFAIMLQGAKISS